MNVAPEELDVLKSEQIERGKRIKYIREIELRMSKTKLAEKIGVSSQFLYLVEEGKGNLVYRSLKKLKEISGHSVDYILFGVDDNVIKNTKIYLESYSDAEILATIEIIKNLAIFIKHS